MGVKISPVSIRISAFILTGLVLSLFFQNCADVDKMRFTQMNDQLAAKSCQSVDLEIVSVPASSEAIAPGTQVIVSAKWDKSVLKSVEQPLWVFPDGSSASELQASYVLNKSGEIKFSGIVLGSDNCESKITRDINFVVAHCDDPSAPSLTGPTSVKIHEQLKYQINGVPTCLGPVRIQWLIDDAKLHEEGQSLITQYKNLGEHEIKAILSFDSDKSAAFSNPLVLSARTLVVDLVRDIPVPTNTPALTPAEALEPAITPTPTNTPMPSPTQPPIEPQCKNVKYMWFCCSDCSCEPSLVQYRQGYTHSQGGGSSNICWHHDLANYHWTLNCKEDIGHIQEIDTGRCN